MSSPPSKMLKTALLIYADELIERLDREINETQDRSAAYYRNYLKVRSDKRTGLIPGLFQEWDRTQHHIFQDFALGLSTLEGQRKIASDVFKIVNHYNAEEDSHENTEDGKAH